MKHPSEPWSAAPGYVVDANGFPVAEVDFLGDYERDEAIRNRIVASVNACAGMEDPATEIEALREEVKRLRGEHGPKQDYSNAPSWDIKELDIIFAVREQEGTNYLYKSESGYHGFKDKLSKKDMDKGGFRLIWERGKE